MYYRKHMRRGISIFLILFFGMGPLLATLEGSDDTSLPACCRRHGEHHCAITAQMLAMIQAASGSTPMLAAPLTCPVFPGFMAGPATPAHALAASQLRLPAPHLQVLTFVHGRVNAQLRSVLTHAGRGPPTPSQI
jgi:hypothetical protein